MPAKADRTFPLQLLKRAIGLFVAFSVVITAIAYPIVSSYERNRFEVIKAREIGYLAAHSRQVEQTFFEVVGDLNLAAHLSAQEELRLGGVTSFFKQILEQFDRYNAISLLNPKGHEVVRVHRVENGAAVAASDELQDQSASPSFKQARRLGPAQIYLSRVIRPPETTKAQDDEAVIELARAVADEHGHIQGVVAFTYHASKLFKELQRIDYSDSSNRINMFVNKEGNWFSNSLLPDSPLHRVLDREEGSFAEQFSNEWSTIGTNDHGELRSDRGLFLYATVYPLKQERLENAAQRAA